MNEGCMRGDERAVAAPRRSHVAPWSREGFDTPATDDREGTWRR